MTSHETDQHKQADAGGRFAAKMRNSDQKYRGMDNFRLKRDDM
jgi:hypothetical protein